MFVVVYNLKVNMSGKKEDPEKKKPATLDNDGDYESEEEV